MTRVRVGARSRGQGGWHTESCTAVLPVGWQGGHEDGMATVAVSCQRPRQWQADTERAHLLHLWRGIIDDRKVEITWSDPS